MIIIIRQNCLDEDKTEKGKNTLMIESAERTEYFNIEKIDENYIKISACNVVVDNGRTKKSRQQSYNKNRQDNPEPG